MEAAVANVRILQYDGLSPSQTVQGEESYVVVVLAEVSCRDGFPAQEGFRRRRHSLCLDAVSGAVHHHAEFAGFAEHGLEHHESLVRGRRWQCVEDPAQILHGNVLQPELPQHRLHVTPIRAEIVLARLSGDGKQRQLLMHKGVKQHGVAPSSTPCPVLLWQVNRGLVVCDQPPMRPES
mgnify:CR=1 FL=1